MLQATFTLCKSYFPENPPIKFLIEKIFSALRAKNYLIFLGLFLIIFEASYLFSLYREIRKYDVFDKFDEYQTLVQYKANINNQNNDVVFVGDSSCLEGVRPKIIEQRTGLKVINLALYGSSGPQAYDAILRKYLKNNPPPKLIIYYFSPSMPNLYKNKYFQKIYVCLMHFNIMTFLSHYDLINPFFDLPSLRDYLKTSSAPKNSNFVKLFKRVEEEKGYDDSHGLVQGLPEKHIMNSKSIYPETIGTKNDPLYYLEKFKNDFTTPNTKVLLYLAPMTAGDNSFQYFLNVYKKIVSNVPYKLPNRYFRDYTHLLVKGADENSKLVAKFLLEHMKNAI